MVFDHVRGGIKRLSPEPVCEECIAERPRLSATSQVNTKARELAGANGFEREFGRLFAVRWSPHGDSAAGGLTWRP